MKETEEHENPGLDVKFYPIRNRYLEKTVHRLSRLIQFILILCTIIVLVVIADFSGYVFQDVKNFFKGSSEFVGREEALLFDAANSVAKPSMYAGHSVSTESSGQIHDRESFQTMLVNTVQDSQSTKEAGYFGVDVSHWQQSIDWSEVAADSIPQKVHFSIVKATQGGSLVDPDFTSNWQQSNELFEIAGAYHYFIFSEDPLAQANNFSENVALSEGNLPPIVDVELNCTKCDSLNVSRDQMIKDLTTFLEEIEKEFQLKPIIYTNTVFYQKYIEGEFRDYTFWMAQYEKTPPAGLVGFQSTRSDSNSAPMIVMWQFTNNEKLNGIIGRVDMNFLPEQAITSIDFAKQ